MFKLLVLSGVALLLSPLAAHAQHGLPAPVTDADFYDAGAPDADKVSLGRDLFFDKVLSGNLNISCASCHHALTDTGDGLSLPVGEGGRGLGVVRDTGFGDDAVVERVPRNAPPVFNLGAREFSVLFHDGRVSVNASHPSGFDSPAGDDLPMGLDNPLAVQAMFPVTSLAEMAGQPGENPVADAAAADNLAGPAGVWALLARRLQVIPGYVKRFALVYDDIDNAADITFVHAANAIGAFEATAWRADNSPYDRYLRGDHGALSRAARRGMAVFYSPQAGNCAVCHSGAFKTDHSFRAIAMPQIGPGKGDGIAGYEDFGHERVTGLVADRYRFRVPTLRSVALTGPWGHDGAYDTLEAVVRHHLDPVAALNAYDTAQARLPYRADLDALDWLAHTDDAVRASIAGANELAPRSLSEQQVTDLLVFLTEGLTDPAMLDLRADVPDSVPSGLPLRE